MFDRVDPGLDRRPNALDAMRISRHPDPIAPRLLDDRNQPRVGKLASVGSSFRAQFAGGGGDLDGASPCLSW
jgi:hypothetical protein